jgi:cholesterol transport system auxiliary component
MMKKNLRTIAALLSACALLLGGCTFIPRQEPSALYDLGPLRAAPASPALALPAITVAEVHAPVWLETPQMYYRLTYVNAQHPQSYSSSRWTMPPVLLFGQRVKSRLAQAGGIVLSAQDGAANVPVLRIEADDFTQHFTAPGQSMAQVSVRASVFNGRSLLAQKTFTRQAPAPTPDAVGGAKALSEASDAVIDDMMSWLAGLQLKK